MRYLITAGLIFLSVSCSEVTGPDLAEVNNPLLENDGLFLVNEGNYLSGNGSLSFFSEDSVKIVNDLYREVNGKPLGDVPNYVFVHGDTTFIIVNNSGKIEVVETHSGKKIAAITGLVSPRRMAVSAAGKAYVTSLYSDNIYVIDLKSLALDSPIKVRRSTEAISVEGNWLYATSWSEGEELLKIDLLKGRLTDSLKTGYEPESMQRDRMGYLWILCSGGYDGSNAPKLERINTDTMEPVSSFSLPAQAGYPVSLNINSSGDSLFFIGNGVWKMCTESETYSAVKIIEQGTRNFYRLAVSRSRDILYLTDARDYQVKGYLLRYTTGGRYLDIHSTGIIPGNMFYKNKAGNL